MAKLAAIGGSEFIVGFQLAGIRNTIEANKNIMEQVDEIKKNKEISIVVIDEKILQGLDEHDRNDIGDSVEPVFIPVSTEASQESLKRLIKKSIGVDLWK